MGLIIKPYTFSAGATIIAAEHNSNYDTVFDEFNGNIDNNNIKSTAAIAYSKLTLTAKIVNADVMTTAGILGSKVYPAFAHSASVAGNITISSAGAGLLIAEGVNASMGTALLQGGTGIVSTAFALTQSRIFLQNIGIVGTAGVLYVSNISNGVSFKINSTVATDSSKIAYMIVNPA